MVCAPCLAAAPVLLAPIIAVLLSALNVVKMNWQTLAIIVVAVLFLFNRKR